jgi:hypothetical protein
LQVRDMFDSDPTKCADGSVKARKLSAAANSCKPGRHCREQTIGFARSSMSTSVTATVTRARKCSWQPR